MEIYQYPTRNLSEPVKYIVKKDRAHYYHAKKTCISNRHPYFNNTMIEVTEACHAFTEQHKLQLVLEP